jgi:regulator of PEP synthase PpsR (kinase-PPPase family)
MNAPQSASPSPIFVVTGGTGASGEHLVRAALAQFPDVPVPLEILPNIRSEEQVTAIVERAAAARGSIAHTLVDANLRHSLTRLAQGRHVPTIDLIGSLLAHLSQTLGREPLGQPGLYRNLRQAYFDRIEAIEYAVAHDDGHDPRGWARADVVLVGVSRVGKTPLSMYLAIQGWKVANVPLVREAPVPDELFRLDPQRVVGLMIDPDRLALHRQRRSRRLHLPAGVAYADVDALDEEIIAARRLCRQHRFATIDVTDRPIEESANEVIALVGPTLGRA